MPVVLRNSGIFLPPSSNTDYTIDFTTAAIENPLSAGGQWALSADTTNFLTGGRVATMTGGTRGCVGYTGNSFNDDVSVLVGTRFLGNQYVWATFYNSGSSLGNYEFELHANSSSTGPNDQKCYALAMVAGASFQLGKWLGPFRDGTSSGGPIILRSQVALPATMQTGDQLGLLVDGPSNLRRLRCIYRPLGVSGTYLNSVVGDTVVLSFLDDGTNTGSNGGDAPENRDPDADTVLTNNTPPLTGGNPGLAFDNSGAEVLNGGFTFYRAYTRALG